MQSIILVVEKETKEVLVFNTLAEAAGYIEPFDIAIYDVYDLAGFRYELTVTKSGILNPDKVLMTKTPVQELENLHKSVTAFLSRGTHRELPKSLGELVSLIPVTGGK